MCGRIAAVRIPQKPEGYLPGENKSSFVSLHPSYIHDDSQYYIDTIHFVTIFTSIFAYTYIEPRRANECKS
jgi:hypothetical protein